MNLLVFNCGSSSLNYKVFSGDSNSTAQITAKGKAHRVGVKGSDPSFIEHHLSNQTVKETQPLETHAQAAERVLQNLRDHQIPIDAVGHRFVHGGAYFKESALLTEDTLARLTECLPLAPIHNPNSMSVIYTCLEHQPGCPQYVTFDTAFHAALPPEAYTYAVPQSIRDTHTYRRFGFHGLSYHFVTQAAGPFLETPFSESKIIACHLGTGGSSAVALKNGVPLDTSMGFTPLPGLIMSTRTGDLDAQIPIQLLKEGKSPKEIETLLNKKSGLLGISQFSSDLRDILARVEQDPNAHLAFEMAVHRLVKYIGAYAVLLGGLDALIFTDDIGLWSWQLRESVCQGLTWCGIAIDPTANREAPYDRITPIEAPDSRARVLVIPTDEEWVIGQEGFALLQEGRHAYH
ncbi:hypothetical protein ADN00_01005 [Ornatilinea apprima]|uniref:Acetate kinase n=1 Tax=Ornatilinea apprima TaxID=1134406 RepID=A0A0P6XX80_9CHLR|nr:acetate/propionate family kinase [Ornatilinea apprima]KPL81131.1 hypothetical protein ADN00_01005 [Ornatilinea apprima]